MADARTKHLRRLRKLRRSARGWSVRAGLLAGASAILVPYQGLGLADAAWAAAAGGSIAVAVWRWVDLRSFALRPLPPPTTPELAAAETRQKLTTALLSLPAGHLALGGIRRYRTMLQMRGLPVAGLWRRLDRASVTLATLRGRLSGPASDVLADAAAGEGALRELAERALGVERVMRTVSGPESHMLAQANDALLAQLVEGVSAYEHLVTAAATYIAEDTRMTDKNPAIGSLTEASELLRCIAESMSEFRKTARD